MFPKVFCDVIGFGICPLPIFIYYELWGQYLGVLQIKSSLVSFVSHFPWFSDHRSSPSICGQLIRPIKWNSMRLWSRLQWDMLLANSLRRKGYLQLVARYIISWCPPFRFLLPKSCGYRVHFVSHCYLWVCYMEQVFYHKIPTDRCTVESCIWVRNTEMTGGRIIDCRL
jgi:hypothetical protein